MSNDTAYIFRDPNINYDTVYYDSVSIFIENKRIHVLCDDDWMRNRVMKYIDDSGFVDSTTEWEKGYYIKHTFFGLLFNIKLKENRKWKKKKILYSKRKHITKTNLVKCIEYQKYRHGHKEPVFRYNFPEQLIYKYHR